jgi:hypothetical protein
MHATLAADPEMKTRFKAFAIGQYISESILFLDDAETFKRLFFEKGETWRTAKARLLVKRYIEPGADLQINFGDGMRDAISSRLATGGRSQRGSLTTPFARSPTWCATGPGICF